MANAPGRPSTAKYPTVTAQHRDTGQALAWSDGEFAGDPEYLEAVRDIHAAGDPVELGTVTYPVDDTPAGAAAAMLAAFCGRGVLVDDSADHLGSMTAPSPDIEGVDPRD